MTKQLFFQPGQPIVMRQLSHGKLWQARPAIVVRDSPGLMAFFIPAGAIWKDAAEKITPAKRIHKSWAFKDRQWGFGGILRLAVPEAYYSVLLLRNTDGSLYEWYINLEEPLRRTGLGFDYEDNILDIGIKPDLSSWRWKDEDELTEAVELGLVSQEKAAALYVEGEKAVKWLLSGKSPFNEWINWQPDPSWQVPVLPKGWDKI